MVMLWLILKEFHNNFFSFFILQFFKYIYFYFIGPTYTIEDLQDNITIESVIKDSLGDILIQKHNKYGFITIPIGKSKPGQTAKFVLREELFVGCDIVTTDFKLICKKI